MKIEINGRALKMPDFLIVGAAKSGTTSVYNYLRQHPQIFMPDIKEPRFFAFYESCPSKELWKDSIWKLQEYLNLFDSARNDQIIGEASTLYLYLHEETIKNIKKHTTDWKDVKIIVILRNPVDAVFSHYMMYKLRGLETLGLEDALDKSIKGLSEIDYLGVSSYYQQLKAYLDNFPHVKVYLFDDLKANTLGVVQDIFRFLGVDYSFVCDVGRIHNPSGNPRSWLFNRIIWKPGFFSSIFPFLKIIPLKKRAEMVEKLWKLNLHKKKPKMKEETKRYLKNLYREDILKVQDLIGRDLSAWLK